MFASHIFRISQICAASLATLLLLLFVAPGIAAAYDRYVPSDKKLDPAWVQSLTAKGERKVYRGEELKFIGMPCGGIGAGQIEITGEGTLGTWWIFNENIPANQAEGRGSNGYHYMHPKPIDKRVENGFAIRITEQGKSPQLLELSRKDFDGLAFVGEYPIATLDYRKSGARLPVSIQSEVFSPFVPLSVRDSANPVTVLRYSVTNTSEKPVAVALGGWLQNYTFPQRNDKRLSQVVRTSALTTIQHGVDPAAPVAIPSPIEWDNFEAQAFDGHWSVEGDAFADGPVDTTAVKYGQPLSGYAGVRIASSFPKEGKEKLTGKLVSKPFRISRKYILFSIAGGKFPKSTCVNLKVDGEVVLSETGDASNTLRPVQWEVGKWSGQEAVLEIVDDQSGGWGFVHVDNIRFVEEINATYTPVGNGHPQYGDLALSVLDPNAQASASWKSPEAFLAAFGSGKAGGENKRGGNETGYGSVASELTLQPGETRQVTFLVSWWFPNNRRIGWSGRIYNNWYKSSSEVAAYVAANFERLHAQTKLFRDTYFDTSLPYWLANRITMPVSILACDNVVIFQNGRFYSDEGIGFCPGTCGHVFNFVTALGKLFPELERSVRLQQDLDERYGFDPLTGRINFRGHDGPQPDVLHAYASDAQSGYVLKIYREHLNSPDGKFLASVWPKVKKVIGYQIFQDGAGRGLEPNGVLEGLQTMWDPMWFGPNPYNQSLYLAALRASEQMARLQGEEQLAKCYRGLFESGQRYMNEQMWNGRYYVHLYPQGFDVVHSTNGVLTPKEEQKFAGRFVNAFNNGAPHYFVSTACDAQQLFGQTWANQLGLGAILPPERCRSAAASIFDQNWTPDIASVYKLYPPRHRTLGAFGEPGMVNGSWQTEERKPFENIHDKDDLWTGLEYQAACDMLSAGLLKEGLTVIRSIDERYNPMRRNPWNEIEGSERYVRSMHSWNVLLVLSGFTYDGPAAKIAFAPRITPHDFKAFFSGAEGWGSFSQKQGSAALELKWGELPLKEIALALPGAKAAVRLGSQTLPCRAAKADGRLRIVLDKPVVLTAGSRLEIQTSE